MRPVFLFVLLVLSACKSTPDEEIPFPWLAQDTSQKTEWLHKQRTRYKNYKNRYSDSIFSTQKSLNQDSLSFKTNLRYQIGTHYFYINDKGIYYSKHLETKNYLVFKTLSSLSFKPQFISINHSGYLIIKGSKFSNDKYIVQVWDIKHKKLLKEIQTQDYPKIQATENNLYFYGTQNTGKPIVKRYHFSSDEIYETDFKSIYSVRVLDYNKILTTSKNKNYLTKDDSDFKSSFLFEKDSQLKFIDYHNQSFFFYKNENAATLFYQFKEANQKLELIYTLNKSISLTHCVLNSGKLYFSFIENGTNNLSFINTQDSSLHSVLTHKFGTFKLVNNCEDSLIVLYSSFKINEIVYQLDKRGLLSCLSKSINSSVADYNVSQKWVSFKSDSIPILFYFKDSLLQKNAPLIMYAYGGFKNSITPKFNTHINSFIANGGVYAIAGVRGGGELGVKWHDQAIKKKKKQTFLDFKACLDFVIKNKISQPQKMAIMGSSNGGLLVNYSILNFSNKFKVAISMKGLSDMVNYPKYNKGKYWINEYGDPKNWSMHNYLKSYSPLHNLKKISNEALKVLVITGDKDDRVTPLHSYKFVYGLQQNENENVYLNVIKNVGHTMPIDKLNAMYTDVFKFIDYNLDLSTKAITNENI